MKQLKKIILLLITTIVILIIGYLLRKERIVYNQGDTYYVMDYFTISKFVSIIVIVFFLVVLVFEKVLKKNG